MCIFSNVPTSVMIFDLDGRLIDANEHCYNYHDVHTLKDLEESLRTEGVWKHIQAGVSTAIVGSATIMQYSFDGKRCRVVANEVRDEQGELIGISVLEKDITLRHNMINELKQMKLKEITA